MQFKLFHHIMNTLLKLKHFILVKNLPAILYKINTKMYISFWYILDQTNELLSNWKRNIHTKSWSSCYRKSLRISHQTVRNTNLINLIRIYFSWSFRSQQQTQHRHLFNPPSSSPRRREKNWVKFLFSHFFVMPQKV